MYNMYVSKTFKCFALLLNINDNHESKKNNERNNP